MSINKIKDKRVNSFMRIWCRKSTSPYGIEIEYKKPLFMDVSEISRTGVGIICKYQFEENTLLNFTLFLNSISYEVMAIVRWGKIKDSYFAHGVEIIGNNNLLFNHLKSIVDGDAIL